MNEGFHTQFFTVYYKGGYIGHIVAPWSVDADDMHRAMFRRLRHKHKDIKMEDIKVTEREEWGFEPIFTRACFNDHEIGQDRNITFNSADWDDYSNYHKIMGDKK